MIIPSQFIQKNSKINNDFKIIFDEAETEPKYSISLPDKKDTPKNIFPRSIKRNIKQIKSTRRLKNNGLFQNWQTFRPTASYIEPDDEKYPPFKVVLSLSPFKISQAANERDVSYGIRMNYENQNFEYGLRYDRSDFSTTDILSKITVIFGSHNAILTFDVNKIWKNLTYFLMLNYQRKNEGKIFIIENNFQVGPLGLKYKFYKNEEYIKELSLSVVPLYEIRSENVLSPSSTIVNRMFSKVNEQVLRLSCRLRWTIELYKDVLSLRNTFFIRPSYHITLGRYYDKDLNFDNELQIRVALSNLISLKYQHDYIWDRRNSAFRGIPLVDIIQTYKIELTKSF